MHYLNYADDGTRIPPVQAEPVEAQEPWKPLPVVQGEGVVK